MSVAVSIPPPKKPTQDATYPLRTHYSQTTKTNPSSNRRVNIELGTANLRCFFFSCVKIKVCVWFFFLSFFNDKKLLSRTFFCKFRGSGNFSRLLLRIFSRMDFVFSWGGHRYWKFSRMGFAFSRVKYEEFQ